MKNLFVVSIAVLAFVLTFSSCKKDEKSLDQPTLELENQTSGLTSLYLSHSSLSISGKVAPESAPDNKVTIKITTAEDPAGIEFTANTTDGEYVDGKIKYLYKSFSAIVDAANHTDATHKQIKVNSSGDNIKVVIGSNVAEKSFAVNCNEVLSYTYWSTSTSGTLFLYGYNFNGSASKMVEVWSTRDDQHVNISGMWSNPAQYQALPSFTNYSFDFNFNDGWSYPVDTVIGIYPEGDTLFIKYNNATYATPYNTSSGKPLIAN